MISKNGKEAVETKFLVWSSSSDNGITVDLKYSIVEYLSMWGVRLEVIDEWD